MLNIGLGPVGAAGAPTPAVVSANATAQIVLSANTVAENASNGTTIGTLSVVNGTGSWTFSEFTDPDSKFSISGSSLQKAAALDYESKTSHPYTVQATNGTDTIQATFTIFVTDVDDTAPTITSASSASVAENATLAHALTANESVTWSIVGGADQAQFEISGSTLRWASNGTKNYEAPADADTNNTYVVQVRATDGASNTTNQTITITVTNVLEVALAALALSNADFSEGASAGTVIGAIQNGSSGSTITLQDSAGSKVAISGGNLVVGASAASVGSFDITLRETHPDGTNSPRDTVISITVEAAGEVTIDAPTNVTYVDGTNPPLFSMNYSDTGPGAVLVGDVLQKRYASAPGTVYDSDPITEIPVLQPVEFSDPVQADGTIDEGQLRWSRTGGIYSEWSNVAEPGSGAYEIISVGAPEAFVLGDWSVADLVTSGDIRVTVTTLPDDNGSAITDIEYRIDAGTWTSSGTATTGTFDISGLTDDVEVTVELRAVNAEGAGPDSDDKTVTPTAPASYETESEAIFAAFTTPPDNAHKAAINFFVLALKTASIWSKFDFIYGLAAADSQAARINWVNPGTYNATVTGSPTFTADRGYVGASGAYLSSGFNPTTAPSPKFTQNDANMFIWALDGGTATGAISGEIGASNSRIGKDFGAGDSIARPNMSSSIQPMTTTGFPGSVGWTRSASNVWEAYANGVDAGGGTGASAAPSNEVFRVCSSIAANGLLQIAFAMVGSNLTSGEVAALHDAMNDYLVAVGAI